MLHRLAALLLTLAACQPATPAAPPRARREAPPPALDAGLRIEAMRQVLVAQAARPERPTLGAALPALRIQLDQHPVCDGRLLPGGVTVVPTGLPPGILIAMTSVPAERPAPSARPMITVCAVTAVPGPAGARALLTPVDHVPGGPGGLAVEWTKHPAGPALLTLAGTWTTGPDAAGESASVTSARLIRYADGAFTTLLVYRQRYVLQGQGMKIQAATQLRFLAVGEPARPLCVVTTRTETLVGDPPDPARTTVKEELALHAFTPGFDKLEEVVGEEKARLLAQPAVSGDRSSPVR
jgi:hypothetical protein